MENSLSEVCLQAASLWRYGSYLYMGIDPGATGAVAILAGGKAFVGDVPTLKVKKSSGGNKTEMNLPALIEALRQMRAVPKERIQVAIEQAQAGGAGQGGGNLTTSFRVGTFFGSFLGILATLGLPYARIHPGVWKKAMGLTKQDKEASRLLALELFPGADIALKKHHDRAESILIAEYYRRKMNGGT